MTWREKVVVRILLIVARMLVDHRDLEQEIDKLATHISVGPPAETKLEIV